MEKAKIISGLEKCTDKEDVFSCHECPYWDCPGEGNPEDLCFEKLMADALQLIQEAKP